MPSKHTSPFGPSFTSAINRGTPCSVAVHNIATRTGKTPTYIFNSLWKANLCYRQKVGGQWIYWPCNTPKKFKSTYTKACQGKMWQWFVDWCLCNGFCTPTKLHNCPSQQSFINFCGKFWNKQSGTSSSVKTRSTPKRKPKTARKPKSTPKMYGRSYKFPGIKTRTTKRYRKAA
jgi:hypothetical protein